MIRPIAAIISRLPFMIRGLRFASRWANQRSEHTNDPAPNRLKEYFDSHTHGRGIWKWDHYFEAYEKHFNKFIGKEIHILEIGIYSGGSLEMWKDYFGPQARIYGVDIEPDCKAYEDEQTTVFIGDQGSRAFWAKVKSEAPLFDIVIDDGGHKPEQQIITLEELLPHIRPGGVYLCEDIHGVENSFHLYVLGLAAQLNGGRMRTEDKDLVTETNAFQSAIGSIHLYPYLCAIKTREAAQDQIACRRHGSSWQPFF